jgi:hypothetical protein
VRSQAVLQEVPIFGRGATSRSCRSRGLLPVLACAVLLTFAAAPREARASMSANWGTGVQAPLPANARSNPDVSLRSVSCASPGNCVAAGNYIDSMDGTQGLLLTETAGVWGTVELESGLGPSAVSCPSAGNCTAVAGGKVLSETGGVWGSAAKVTPPANAASGGILNYISCSSAENCTAAGSYTETSGRHEGLLVTETNGRWGTGVEASLPANANPDSEAYIEGLSCASAGNCAAVGEYYDGAVDEPEIFLLTETEGTWGTAVQAEVPANAHSDWNTIVKGVSCGSVGNCAVVGEYFDASGEMQGLLLNETNGTWGRGVEARLPANASPDPGPFIEEVQCASAGNCTAAGSYIDSAENTQGLLLTETSGTWGTGIEAPLPAGARSGPRLIGGSLSCPSAGDCSYVDGYYDSAEHSEGLLLTQSQGVWAPALQAALPLNAGTEPEVILRSVSCAMPGHCTAVGEYTDSEGHVQGLLLTAAPTTADLSASGPLGGAFAGSAISPSSISAALAGGSSPSGTVTFTVFGPQSSPPSSCISGGTVVGTASASGYGTYHPSTGFTPSSPGDYWWYASYGGDVGDEPSTSTCGSGMAETTVVAKSTPTLSLSGPMGGTAGSQVSASSIAATLAGGSSATGTITFTVFGPQSSPPSSCVSGGATVGTASVNGDGTYQPSAGFTPPSPGEYWWYASYGGSAGDEPAASACGALMAQTLVAAPPVGESGPGSNPGSGSSGAGTGTGAKPPAPALSDVKLASKRLTASTVKKGVALKLTVSQAATIEVRIAQNIKAHEARGACKLTAKAGKRCSATVQKRTLTLSGSAGSNAFKLRLAGLGKGSYTATITAENANGKSSSVRLAFTLADK